MPKNDKVDTPPDKEEHQPSDDIQDDIPTDDTKTDKSQSGEDKSDKNLDPDGELSKTLKEIQSGVKEIKGRLTKVEQAKKSAKKGFTKPPSSDGRFSFDEPEEEEEEVDDKKLSAEDEIEYAKVKQGVAELLIDNENYQKLVKKDKTLQRIIKKDPLALLDSMPIDSEDAVNQIQEVLDSYLDDGDDKDKKDKDKDKKDKKDEDKEGSEKEEDTPPEPAPQGKGTEKKDKKDDNSPKSTMEKVKGSIYDRAMGNKT